ncbi:MAG: sulfite exporter TauE/SafE family protein [Spirochaetaceae bacterium]|jgi:sulfite exporter TauE/SafE/copper chaperone CopZ/plastocyanin domain-containing protein|nr:sulfite exporter TauE/SafE family protein [Spirochaetaceae bacterium]
MKTEGKKTAVFRIGGMSCTSCRDRIEKNLRSAEGVEDAAVSYNDGTARVGYDPAIIDPEGIRAVIEKLGYSVLDGARHESKTRLIGTLVIILALYMILRQFGTGGIAGAFPLAEAGMGYGMLFIIGLVTSVHCAAMCGGINLSQCLPAVSGGNAGGVARLAVLFPSILYNAGRVVSYTAAGVIVGALGSALTVTGAMQGIVQIAAGVFMAVMGANMLGLFPALRRFTPRMPRIFAKKIGAGKRSGKSPLAVGLLNGLMPCGPLQAMQLYALSTGSPLRGGISMFLFSAGTVPLMFGLGALGSFLSDTSRGRGFSAWAMKAGAVLVTVLGLTMFTNGWNLGGFPGLPEIASGLLNPARAYAAPFGRGDAVKEAAAAAAGPVFADGVQTVSSTLSPGRYPAITVRAGVPVRWTISAPQGSINGCNNRMIIREYGIEHRFKPGENIIEFTPDRAGRFPYSCWMGMIRSSITVVAEGGAVAEDTAGAAGGPVPAGVTIPSGEAVVAGIDKAGVQRVTINLTDDGFSPSVIVMQKGLRTEWTIKNDSLDEGNSALVFPLYYTQIEMAAGDNIIEVIPSSDFEFSTVDNIFYGYVKAVDDIGRVDIEAVKKEAAEFETLIYPDAYFEAAGRGGCCGSGRS